MIKNMLISGLATAILSILFTGCISNTSIKVKDYKAFSLKQNMNKEEIVEKLKKANKIRRIALLSTESTNQPKLAKNIGLDNILKSNLKKYLMETGNVRFLADINANHNLKEKIIDLEYDGIEIKNDTFDYLILTKIENASFTNRFTEAFTYECIQIVNNQKRRTTCVSPPSMTYTAEVSGSIEVLHLLDNRLISELNIPFSDNASRSQDVRREVKLKTDNALMAKATKDAVKQNRIKIMNHFAAKGFIRKGKRNGDDYIFQTTLGLGKIKEGDKVNIYHEEKEVDPLTGKIEVTITEIAKAVVSSESTNKHSWIIIDGDNGENVSLGDFIKVQYESDFMDSMLKVGTFLNSITK